MRVLVGLAPPTAGTATIGGRRFADLPNPGTEVGVLLDASAQHAGRTGREILAVAARYMGLPARRVEDMLDTVGLTPAEAGRRVRNCCGGTPTAAAPCCCPPTCCTRSRWWPTTS
jgi:ABC-2 type transport system ATP-binding protein